MNRAALPALCAVLVAALAILLVLAWRRFAAPQSADERFRDGVLAQLRVEFPSRTFETVADDPTLITTGGFRINLSNARKQYELSNKTDQALAEIVKEYQVFWSTKEMGQRFSRTYDEAKHRLLPQFMPPAVAADEESVKIRFEGGIFFGIVVDDERSYSYLTREVVRRWGQTEEAAYSDALKNLNTRSHGMQFPHFTQFGASFLAVSTRDGFDAARIAVPEIKKAFGDKLGYPFYFGIPNREFLVCWSATAGTEAMQFAREKLRHDFQKQPYPISPFIFQVATGGTIKKLPEAEPSAAPTKFDASKASGDR